MEFLTNPVFYVILAVIAAFVGARYYADKRRKQAMAGVAQQLGLEFEESVDDGMLERFSDLHLFGKGSNRKVLNLMTARRSRVEIMIFDYRYQQGGGKNRRSSTQTVVAFELVGMDLPGFECRSENVFHKIGQVFGYQDIDFDDDPEFSKSMVLRGEDVSRIRQMMNRDIRNFIKENKELSVEGKHNLLLVYRHAKQIKPDRIVQALDTAESLRGMLA